jgi:hypothetical protein
LGTLVLDLVCRIAIFRLREILAAGVLFRSETGWFGCAFDFSLPELDRALAD